MKKLLIAMISVLMLLSSTGCNFLFKKPQVTKVHDFKVISLGVDKIELEVAVSVLNPNAYQLKLDKLDIELLNKERDRIGSATMQKTVVIPKHKANALSFRIKLDTRPTARMISHSNQTVYLYVAGRGHGKVLGFGKNFSFEEPYEMDLKRHLEMLIPKFEASGQDLFKVQRSYVKKLGFTQAELHVDFMLLNPYGLTFRLKGFPAEVFLGDKSVGKGNLSMQMSFNENTHSKEGTMVFKINNWRALGAALKGVFQGEIPYRVQGTVMIEAFGLEINKPYNYQGAVPINLSDMVF